MPWSGYIYRVLWGKYGVLVSLGAPPLAAGACGFWEIKLWGWRGPLLPLALLVLVGSLCRGLEGNEAQAAHQEDMPVRNRKPVVLSYCPSN